MNRLKQELIGASASFQEVLRVTGLIAKLNVPVLILGETGSGKHSIAKHLHAQSNRSNFVNVNCRKFVRYNSAWQIMFRIYQS